MPGMTTGPRATALGLRAVRTLASSDLLDRLRARDGATRVLHRASRDGFRAAATASRTFASAQRKLAKPARLTPAKPDLFDLTPTDEQQLLQATLREFAAERLRPAAPAADAACATPPDLLAEATELGIAMLAVPEELGGVQTEASAVTAVLAAEALAHGDMGLAVALLAPAGVAAALTLWGDERQQETYLPAFTGDDVPAAAVALLEPHPLADPFAPRTQARALPGGDYEISGVKALVPRAVDAELLLVAARLPDDRPALFLVEPHDGVEVRPAPAMGVRAAATGDVRLDAVRVPGHSLLGDGDPDVHSDCVRRSRLAWCALAVGAARAVLDHVIPYVNERRAFGEPVSHRQAVAFNVAGIAIELESMRLLTLRAAARADAGKDIARDVALAHALCATKGRRIGSDGVGLLGGHGYVREHPVERWYRDLSAVGALEGGVMV
jgi:alkylation response protein AidB-like acyl-CoA dehydrogenase